MISGDNYVFSQRVIDVDNTVYENMMVVNGETEYEVQGCYHCSVESQDDVGDKIDSAHDSTNVTGECCSLHTVIARQVIYMCIKLFVFLF